MAVVDDLGRPGTDAPSEDYGRQPPQDLAAEQSVLGGMLLSKDAIADVLEKLRPSDFYRPAHQNIYDAILDLYGRGEPADAVTVAAELDRRGLLRRIGGAPYVHTLISTVPTAANAGYYAEIVAEKALLRRLVEAGTRVVQYGYAGAEGADVAEVVDRAQAEMYEVTDRRISEDFVPLEDLLQPTMDEIDAIASNGGLARGVPTGFTELDEVTNGLHPGQMIIVAARPGVGKALALDTPLPTPDGWTTMGEVAVGDELLGGDGKPTRVVAATDDHAGPAVLRRGVLRRHRDRRRRGAPVADCLWHPHNGPIARRPGHYRCCGIHGALRDAHGRHHLDGPGAASGRRAPSLAVFRCAACRWTTRRTCIWPAGAWFRPTTRRWGWISCGRARSSTGWPASSSRWK